MTVEPLTPDGKPLLGYLVRYLGEDRFRLAIVVGYEKSDKTLRVRLWRAATKQWNNARKRVRLHGVAPLTPFEKTERATMIANAMDAAADELDLEAHA